VNYHLTLAKVASWKSVQRQQGKIARATLFVEEAHMRFNVTLDRDEDGVWVVECPSIPGCVSQGQTKQEALENIKDAIAACLQVRAERGMPLTVETYQVEVVA
jgi:predicted RNase H-like HicB family nuclease